MKNTSRNYRLALFLLATLMAAHPMASDESESASNDKLLAMSMLHRGMLKLSNQLPASFPQINLPDSLKVFAVANYLGQFSQLVFVSSVAVKEIEQEITSNLISGGWKISLGRMRPQRMSGFVSAPKEKIAGPKSYCHKNSGFLNYSLSEGALGAIGWISVQEQQSAHSICNSSSSLVAFPTQRHSFVQERFPVLELPDDLQQPAVAGMSVGGGSDSHTSSAAVETKLSAEALRSHFEEQLESQDWKESAIWAGAGGVGSVWVLDVEEGISLIGMLTVISESESKYWLNFFAKVVKK